LATRLDGINAERKELQSDMTEGADALLGALQRRVGELPIGLSLVERSWHAGVVGLVASRLKDRLNRPVIAFAPADEGGEELRGSARSVPGFHVRDALAALDAQHPGLIVRFGGHAMAAGLTIAEADYARFAEALERTLEELLPLPARQQVVETDGGLEAEHFTLNTARMLEGEIWGQGFPQPLFCDNFSVENQRVVGERHLKLQLQKDGKRYEAMRFGALDPLPTRLRAAYRLAVNEFNGLKSVQLNVEHYE